MTAASTGSDRPRSFRPSDLGRSLGSGASPHLWRRRALVGPPLLGTAAGQVVVHACCQVATATLVLPPALVLPRAWGAVRDHRARTAVGA